MTTFLDLKLYARRMARDVTGAKGDIEVAQAINEGVRMVASHHLWPWNRKDARLLLNASSSMTVVVTQGSAVVTSTATFPTWCAGCKIKLDGQWWRIVTRDTANQITMAYAWAKASDSAYAAIVYQDEYSLATDCASMARIYPGERWMWGGRPDSWERVLEAQNRLLYGQQYPVMWAVMGSKLIMYPYPTIAVSIPYAYYKQPTDMTLDADVVDVDPTHLELVHRAIDYQLALIFPGRCVAGDPGACMAVYKECVARYRAQDKTTQDEMPPIMDDARRKPPWADFPLPRTS
jgi:hypothetical protein